METLIALIASLKRKKAAKAEFPIPVRKMIKSGGIYKYAAPLGARILKSRKDMEHLWRLRRWQVAVRGAGR